MKLMLAFIAGIFLLIIGFSFLNFQGKTGTPSIFPKIGVALSFIGGVLFVGALFFQMKNNKQDEI